MQDVDDIRENLETRSLVILEKRIMKHEDSYYEYSSPTMISYMTICWVVKDLQTGKRYQIRKDQLGQKTYNEMEVLAWATNTQ